MVKLVKCKNVFELTYTQSISQVLTNFKRLGKDKMVNLATGEVIDCKISESKAENIRSLRQSIKRLRNLINSNFEGSKNELFITLTYAENMTDLNRLYEDFKYFFKKLKKRFPDYDFLYIYTVEPQMRGSWHIHLLLKALNLSELYIDNSVIEALWGHGFVKTKRLNQVDNVGAYLSAYLTDYIDEDGLKCKGVRLYLYPPGMNIYRCSRNCAKPEVFKEKYSKVKESLRDDFKTYEVCYNVLNDDDEIVNVVKKEFYNLKKAKKEGESMKLYFNSQEVLEGLNKLDLNFDGDFEAEFVDFDNEETVLESFTVYGELINYTEDAEEVIKPALIDVVEAEPVANTDDLSAKDFVKVEWKYFDIIIL